MNNYKIKCRIKEIYPSNEGLINHIKVDIKFYINFLGGTDNQTILKVALSCLQ